MGSSSPLSVLAAITTGRSEAMRKYRSTRFWPRSTGIIPGISSDSNFSDPVTKTRSRCAPDAPAVRAEVDDASGRFLALHAEPIDVAEHAAEEGLGQAIPRIRARRDPA